MAIIEITINTDDHAFVRKPKEADASWAYLDVIDLYTKLHGSPDENAHRALISVLDRYIDRANFPDKKTIVDLGVVMDHYIFENGSLDEDGSLEGLDAYLLAHGCKKI